MFQFTRFASHDYVFVMRYPKGWVSPFGNLRIKANLPAPRSLSQAITSFIACNRQGIHHMHLVTWPYNFDASTKSVVKDSYWVLRVMPFFISRELKFVDANQNAIGGTVAGALTFARTSSASADDADSTLRIVKERQPISRSDAQAITMNRLGVRYSGLGSGGGWRDRTDDPLLAKQVLSQLS
jgi:hypothetical protein